MSEFKEKFTAYVTKYALTAGVQEVEAEWSEKYPGMISYKAEGSRYVQFAHGSDWHRSPDVALAKAESMRQRKIESMRRSITKLTDLKLEVVKV